jgi:hypothetical protein
MTIKKTEKKHRITKVSSSIKRRRKENDIVPEKHGKTNSWMVADGTGVISLEFNWFKEEKDIFEYRNTEAKLPSQILETKLRGTEHDFFSPCNIHAN